MPNQSNNTGTGTGYIWADGTRARMRLPHDDLLTAVSYVRWSGMSCYPCKCSHSASFDPHAFVYMCMGCALAPQLRDNHKLADFCFHWQAAVLYNSLAEHHCQLSSKHLSSLISQIHSHFSSGLITRVDSLSLTLWLKQSSYLNLIIIIITTLALALLNVDDAGNA